MWRMHTIMTVNTNTYNKSLRLFDLTTYGLNFMIPLAPAIVYGAIAHITKSSVSIPYMIGIIGMFFTVYSFIFMSKRIASSGSVFTYVSKTLGKHLGWFAGWLMIIDYLLSPAITTSSASSYIQQYFPHANFTLLVILLFAITTTIAAVGIKLVSKLGLVMFLAGEAVAILAMFVWGNIAIQNGSGLSLLPFHVDNVSTLFAAGSMAVMGFFGFDAICNLSEEAKNPQRDIPRAMILALIIGGLTMVLTAYFANLLQANNSVFELSSWQNAAMYEINEKYTGVVFQNVYFITFVFSMAFLNIFATSSLARLIFAMSRDGKLPSYFGKLSPRFNTPLRNIMIIGIIEILMTCALNLDLLANLISFGALTAFVLLNIGVAKSILEQNKFTEKQPRKIYTIIPVIGSLILLAILYNMDQIALELGLIWLIIGVIVYSISNVVKRKTAIAI
jgi:putrescine importer